MSYVCEGLIIFKPLKYSRVNPPQMASFAARAVFDLGVSARRALRSVSAVSRDKSKLRTISALDALIIGIRSFRYSYKSFHQYARTAAHHRLFYCPLPVFLRRLGTHL